MKSSPLEDHLHSRKDLVYWVIDVHNKVNLETGKRLYTHEEVIQIYEKLMNTKIELGEGNSQPPSDRDGKISKLVITILLIIMIILYIFMYFYNFYIYFYTFSYISIIFIYIFIHFMYISLVFLYISHFLSPFV